MLSCTRELKYTLCEYECEYSRIARARASASVHARACASYRDYVIDPRTVWAWCGRALPHEPNLKFEGVEVRARDRERWEG